MKQKTLIEILAEDDGSVDGVVGTIAELCEELRQGRVDDWENTSLLSFLEAMQAWVETMGPRVGEKPSWKFFETMVKAAKIYE
jgi:hypothetical protein